MYRTGLRKDSRILRRILLESSGPWLDYHHFCVRLGPPIEFIIWWCSFRAANPQLTRRTSWKLVGNPGCQPGLATSFKLVRLVGCGLYCAILGVL